MPTRADQQIMPYRYTLQDARDSALADIAGACPSGPRFVSLVNQSQDELARRGNWLGTEVLVKFCVYDHCLTFPRYVATPLGLRMGCHGPADIRNHWYAIEGRGPCDFRSHMVAEDVGTAPTFADVANPNGSPIRWTIIKNNDVGKKLRIFGKFFGGQPIQEKVGGVWVDGLTLTAAKPFIQTSQLVSHITSVVKDETQGMSNLWEVYDVANGTLRALGEYEPNETNPRYRRMRLPSHHNHIGFGTGCLDANGRRIQSIEALVKLEFIPVKNDRDFLFIDVMRAIKMGMMAIKNEDAGDLVTAETDWNSAIRTLNMEDRNRLPKEQTVYAVRTGNQVRNPY